MPLLNAAEEVELAMRIEAGLFAEEKLSHMSAAEKSSLMGVSSGLVGAWGGGAGFGAQVDRAQRGGPPSSVEVASGDATTPTAAP